jgi:hypothetical protein
MSSYLIREIDGLIKLLQDEVDDICAYLNGINPKRTQHLRRHKNALGRALQRIEELKRLRATYAQSAPNRPHPRQKRPSPLRSAHP